MNVLYYFLILNAFKTVSEITAIRVNWEGARSLSPSALLACEVINSAALRDLHTYNTKQAG